MRETVGECFSRLSKALKLTIAEKKVARICDLRGRPFALSDFMVKHVPHNNSTLLLLPRCRCSVRAAAASLRTRGRTGHELCAPSARGHRGTRAERHEGRCQGQGVPENRAFRREAASASSGVAVAKARKRRARP